MTPSKTLNRAIRNLSGHFYWTLATQTEAYYDDLIYHRTDYRKTPLLRFQSQKNRFWGSTARCFVYSSELKAAINNPSDRSSISIVSFGFRSLVLRKHEHYKSGRHLLNEVSSKLQLCGFLPWLVQGQYDSEVTIQATNWLTVGRVPTIIRHALTALSFP